MTDIVSLYIYKCQDLSIDSVWSECCNEGIDVHDLGLPGC